MPAGGPRLLPPWQEGKLQIKYGLLTDPDGRPVAVRVSDGNTAGPTAFTAIVKVVRRSSPWGRWSCWATGA